MTRPFALGVVAGVLDPGGTSALSLAFRNPDETVASCVGAEKLNVGLIGLGRLGRVYARDLATRIPCTRLTAVADVDAAAVDEVAREFGVERSSTDPSPFLTIRRSMRSSSSHRPRRTVRWSRAAAASGKAIFCEKPLSISLTEAVAIRQAVDRRPACSSRWGSCAGSIAGSPPPRSGSTKGVIGDAVVFKSTSRDPYRPSIEYADPRSSGGLILDMGIHDCDLARWYMGEVAASRPIGGLLAYPELAASATSTTR